MDPEKTFCPDRGCRSVRIAPGLPETSQKLLSGPPQFFCQKLSRISKIWNEITADKCMYLEKTISDPTFSKNIFFCPDWHPNNSPSRNPLYPTAALLKYWTTYDREDYFRASLLATSTHFLLVSCSTTSRHRTMHLIEPRSRVFPALYHHSCSWCDGYGYGDGPSDDSVVVCNRWGC